MRTFLPFWDVDKDLSPPTLWLWRRLFSCWEYAGKASLRGLNFQPKPERNYFFVWIFDYLKNKY